MAKKAGVQEWKKKRRKEYLEKREFRYYIFCEGQQTEPSYFEGFKRRKSHGTRSPLRPSDNPI